MFVRRSRACCQTKVPISGIIVQRHIDLQPLAKSCEWCWMLGSQWLRTGLALFRDYKDLYTMFLKYSSPPPLSHMEFTNFDRCSTKMSPGRHSTLSLSILPHSHKGGTSSIVISIGHNVPGMQTAWEKTVHKVKFGLIKHTKFISSIHFIPARQRNWNELISNCFVSNSQ